MSNQLGAHSGLRRRRNLGKKKRALSIPLNVSFLPNDVVEDILSRLPAKDVLRYRCVCKRWCDLTSTHDFIDLHTRRSFPMLLKNDYNGTSLLDKCWEPTRTKAKIHEVYQPYHHHGGIIMSLNGLVVSYGCNDSVFQDGDQHNCSDNFIISNPVCRHVVNISINSYNSDLYGVFFHPVLKEYCTLWRITLSLEPLSVQYKILNLESDPKWRDIRNPSIQNDRIVTISPVLIGKYLYWLIDPCEQRFDVMEYSCFILDYSCDVMEYDIEKEEFRVINCPVPLIMYCRNHIDKNVNLIDIDGDLSLVQVLPKEESVEITIWTLKDDGEEMWTSSDYIVVSSDICSSRVMPMAMAFWNEELVVFLERLYVCNLKLGTVRKFGQKYNGNVGYLSHVTSLVSLKNCKSNICMEEDDENDVRDRGEEVRAP